LKFIGILTAGCAVLRDSSEFAELRDRLKAHDRSFRQLASARAELFANNVHEDVIGFLRAGDMDGALLSSHELLQFAIDAWCSARGDLYPGRKWVWRRLRRSADLSAVRQLRTSYVPEAGHPVPAPETVRRRVSQAQSLIGQAMLLAWATRDSARAGPIVRVARRHCRSRVWRSPHWLSRRYADQWCLSDRTQVVEVPFTAVAAWAFADGLPTDELTDVVVDRTRDWFGVQISAGTARSLIERLLELGVLVRGSSTPVIA
jgi:hypothetical protein